MSWGEMTPTIEDVHLLLGLPVVGFDDPMEIFLDDDEKTKLNTLNRDIIDSRKATVMGRDTTRNNFGSWVCYLWGDQQGVRWYMGHRYNCSYRLEALLAMWLSKFLFYDIPDD
ncbi:PMD domain-containing protein [Cephalotus follicularis]|uniref:PMD domain-containing protein n=1 Tax=Cephalotus follicularis TaxID=3775 RepID=A0A1Q3BEE0_CEPFO|nr:PMD domain-containing protein [Cephalotus follicularis]